MKLHIRVGLLLSFLMVAKFEPGNSKSAKTQVAKFKLSCKGLKNMDPEGAGTSDPYAKVFALGNGGWDLIGQTEVIKEDENPQWEFEFETDVTFNDDQYWKIEIWEYDVGKDDFMGYAIISVDDYFKSGEFKTLPLSEKGTVTVHKS